MLEKNSAASRINEELEEEIMTQKLQNSEIAETVTSNLKQAQEDYQKYLKEEKENFESREKDLREKYELLENKLKKNYQHKEYQLKQEVNHSIEEIQRSIELNDSEHAKTRSENIALKEQIKAINENFNILEHSLRDQIEKIEQELCATKISFKEKAALLERVESIQRFEKNKLDSALAREKDIEMQLKAQEEKCKALETKVLESKKQIDSLNSELLNAKAEYQRELSRMQTKEQEIDQFTQREKEFQGKFNRLKEEKIEETERILNDFEDKLESNSNLLRLQLSKEYDLKIEEYKIKFQELQAENKLLKVKYDQRTSDLQRNQKIQSDKSHMELKENSKDVNSSYEGPLADENYVLKQKLSKLNKQKLAIDQKLSNLKDDYAELELKIKQDSSFFRNETQRKDEELNRVKKKFETKLRETYAEHSLFTEQLRTDLLRLNSEIRTRDSKDAFHWISKNIEDMMKRIPSY